MKTQSRKTSIIFASSLLVLAVTVSQSNLVAATPKIEKTLSIESGRKSGILLDHSNGDDWPAYGRTYGEQHFSPLRQVNDRNVRRLGLSWYMDLGVGNPATIPIEVDGVLYFSMGLSIVHAVDAATGALLWKYDPKVAKYAGKKLRAAWGIRGIAYWNGKIYTGTQDGRLIALDTKTGEMLWSTLTVEPGDGRYITGAPRVFDGKIIIGHGGADTSNARGYVTTYDAETGNQLWRFFLVPGNPEKGFEDKAQEMAAKTWTGEWWKYGGGGAAWNSFTYDQDTDTILVGTGNGSPWNQKIRSPGGGDNLFLSSIIALDASSGEYKWHYQINPGETWDYNATMDMALAELKIGGRLRKVVITAPKNGFFYVIDRITGELISAEKFTKVTWANKINLVTGRPEEVEGARFPDGNSFELWPSFKGGHSWMPMAFSPDTGLAYIPKLMHGAIYSDKDIDIENWVRTPGNITETGVSITADLEDPLHNTSSLIAWNPITQKPSWEVKTPGSWNGGVLATGGNLVFQGQIGGTFSAYAADSGQQLWQFPAQAAVIAAPITYLVGSKQYITVLVGIGSTAGVFNDADIDYHTQRRRVLTFALDGEVNLPALPLRDSGRRPLSPDPTYKSDEALSSQGGTVYHTYCFTCHGPQAISGGTAPDLRYSGIVQSNNVFERVVRDGLLRSNGMPNFEELSDADLNALRQYLRSRSAELRANRN
ncbi:quinohemoprotein ethanol dehydrogenase [Advenella incenata]|uniref:Quinohemoprotein ethanol dehydrogenase n=1 Tax=Advenella incenata TaxID=267800 RepID=A0A4Q7VFU0_9BURK|nr:PQQ-dependent dehydrogenase, methanol/ethanol family [Advenella incenata]RZT94863.1 quinohemoprotein ethanol dehydrogenase [Advenella incenata]